MADTLTIPMPKLRLTVRMPFAYGLRLWLACKLFELGGLVSGTEVDIELADGGPD